VAAAWRVSCGRRLASTSPTGLHARPSSGVTPRGAGDCTDRSSSAVWFGSLQQLLCCESTLVSKLW
jgi:hypothetical protein